MKLKSLLLSAVFLAMSGTAFAADTTASGAVYFDAGTAERWDGFYAGAQIGYGWGESANEWWGAGLPAVADGDIAYSGLMGGLHAGYLVQSASIVWGVEADLSLANLVGDDSQFAGRVNRIEIEALATLRGRMGVAFDNMLVYGTAGAAAASFAKRDVGEPSYTAQLATGWTLGAGVEMAVTESVSVRAEYLHTWLAPVDSFLEALGGGYGHRAIDPTLHTFRAGISFNF